MPPCVCVHRLLRHSQNGKLKEVSWNDVQLALWYSIPKKKKKERRNYWSFIVLFGGQIGLPPWCFKLLGRKGINLQVSITIQPINYFGNALYHRNVHQIQATLTLDRTVGINKFDTFRKPKSTVSGTLDCLDFSRFISPLVPISINIS